MTLAKIDTQYSSIETMEEKHKPPISHRDLDNLSRRIDSLIDTQVDIDKSPIIVKIMKWAFNVENRVRALEGKQPITLQQVKDFINAS